MKDEKEKTWRGLEQMEWQKAEEVKNKAFDSGAEQIKPNSM